MKRRLFSNIEGLIIYYKSNELECIDGEKSKPKRTIAEDKFELNHSDMEIMKKVALASLIFKNKYFFVVLMHTD